MIAVIAGRQAVEDSRGLQGLSGRDLYIFHVGDLLKVASCGTCKSVSRSFVPAEGYYISFCGCGLVWSFLSV